METLKIEIPVSIGDKLYSIEESEIKTYIVKDVLIGSSVDDIMSDRNNIFLELEYESGMPVAGKVSVKKYLNKRFFTTRKELIKHVINQL